MQEEFFFPFLVPMEPDQTLRDEKGGNGQFGISTSRVLEGHHISLWPLWRTRSTTGRIGNFL
jgi:hypothetical protein